MDPITLGGLFLGLAGGIGSLFGTDKANQIAQQNQEEETKLLHEAQQQEAQQKETANLISQRNAQESSLTSPLAKWTAGDTLLGGLATEKAQPTQKALNTPTTQLLGV